MSDIGSDSDATLADSIDEEDVNSPASSPNSHTAEIGYPECVLSLQRGQRVLFEKLEHITAETTTVQYVQGLQEDYLVLEESLHQLNNVTRQERKQLSDELEIVSTTGNSDRSFQQQLLQLSDKQRTLLQCFDNQKRLGSQLKVLLSNHSHYTTRSKTLLQQTHSQENTSGYHDNIKLPSTQVETPKVAMVTSHFTPFKPVQPVKLPSSSQLTSAMVRQLSTVLTTSKASSVGIAKQPKLVGVAIKNQQLQGKADQQKITSENFQLSVGVATQQKQRVGVAVQKQVVDDQKSVGVAAQQKQHLGVAVQKQVGDEQKSVGVATQQKRVDVAVQKQVGDEQKSVGVTTHQQQKLNVTTRQQPVGVATQQQHPVGVATQQLPVGVATENQSTETDGPQSVGVPIQHSQLGDVVHQPVSMKQPRGVATKHQQPVGVVTQQTMGVATQQDTPMGVATGNQPLEASIKQQQPQHSQLSNVVQQPVSMQPKGVATRQQRPMSATPRLLLHSELAQPVPLDVLVQHRLLSPQDQCLTCTLMGCQFTASLAADGSIVSQDGCKFSNPPQWLNNCWGTLGHNKRVDRRTAYTKVNYKDKSLLHYCLSYSQQKVSSYLSRSHDPIPTNKTTSVKEKTDTQPEDIIDMTSKCWMCPISDHELVLSNEWLPAGFWEYSNTVLVNSDIENDVNF